MSHEPPRISAFVFWNATVRPVGGTSTIAAGVVENSRISGYSLAALTILTRSLAVDMLSLDKPVGSLKWECVIPSFRAFAFIAWTQGSVPPG